MDKQLIQALWQCIGRRDTYAVQLETGTYAKVEQPLSERDLIDHLAGRKSLGTYVLSESGRCHHAILDADRENGLYVLQSIARDLRIDNIHLHLERSRRGGHGWIFFDQAYPAEQVRAWLLPLAQQHQLELYPKQNQSKGVGSLIRLPLGIHRRSGTRYPFIDTNTLRAIAHDTAGILTWLPSAARSTCPAIAPTSNTLTEKRDLQIHRGESTSGYQSIREWNAAQDPFETIGRYVDLDQRGGGSCPFGEHHDNGRDDHESFQVYQPGAVGGYCWYCHAWGQGGSVFDFLTHYHNLNARMLWHLIKSGKPIG